MRIRIIKRIFGCLALCCGLLAVSANAQSTDIATPAAVRTNEVAGAITARDLGDSRLTDHFFTFTGTPGDLTITVDARNLNGDVDIFTAVGMRPLLKFTVYEGSAPITKSIYLRKREDLILRVEARTPNDDEGTYQIRFGGSFEPAIGNLANAEPDTGKTSAEVVAAGNKTGKKGRRVSSVGARIDEPPSTEVADSREDEIEPAVKPVPEVAVPRAKTRTAKGRGSARSAATAKPKPAKPAKPAETKVEPNVESRTESKAPENRETEAKSTSGRRRPGKRNSTARAVESPTTAMPESGPRLIIETSDGTLINRYMTSIRRVTVENGQVVVVGKDGKVEKFQLANIVRMSVGP